MFMELFPRRLRCRLGTAFDKPPTFRFSRLPRAGAAGLAALLAVSPLIANASTRKTPRRTAHALNAASGNAAAGATDLLARPRPMRALPFQKGLASWYARHSGAGTVTAHGEKLDDTALTAAHRTLPFGTRLLVHAPRTGRTVIVRVNDRGPFSRHRILDLSRSAAAKLGILSAGVAQVVIQVLPRGASPDLAHPDFSGSDLSVSGPSQDVEVASAPR